VGTVASTKVRRAWNTVKLSPGTPGGAIQLAGDAPSNTRVSCASSGPENATMAANAARIEAKHRRRVPMG
jgi:hypothetical protein